MFGNPLRALASAISGVLILFSAESQAANCPSGQDSFTLDWDAPYATWTNGDLARTISVPDGKDRNTIDVEIQFTGATNRAYQPRFPEVSTYFYGQGSKHQKSLAWAHDLAANSERVTITLTFSAPVSNLSFFVLDVDSLDASGGTGGFRDAVEVQGANRDERITLLPSLSTPAHNSGKSSKSSIQLGAPLAPNQALGYFGQADNGSDYGRLNIDFVQPVTDVTLEYSNKLDPPSSTPAPQGISIGDLEFCADPIPAADVRATKTQRLHSESPVDCEIIPGTPDPAAAFAGPGTCIEYRIEATNSGDSIATKLAIRDTLNDNMIFQSAATSGFENGGSGFGLFTPEQGQDCAGGSCAIALEEANLPPNSTGEIIIRALIK